MSQSKLDKKDWWTLFQWKTTNFWTSKRSKNWFDNCINGQNNIGTGYQTLHLERH